MQQQQKQQVKATVPRIVYLHPAYPRPSWCWVWSWTVTAEHGDTLTVIGQGQPKGGATINRQSESWVMHDDRDAAVKELRARVERAMATTESASWDRIEAEYDPRVKAGA
mgnify:CR=1 FL=1